MTPRLVAACVAVAALAGSRPSAGSLDEQTAPATGALVGTVVSQNDYQPEPGVVVAVWRGDDRRTATTDAAGEFEFRDLPVGIYQWTVEREARRLASFTSDRTAIVWPNRVADQRISLSSRRTTGDGSRAERLQRLSALQDAVDLWIARRPEAYVFSPNLSCFCPLPRRDVRFEVVGVRSTFVGEASAGEAWLTDYNTIEELFETVAFFIDTFPDEFVVAYDLELGYPTSMAVDPRRMVFDEGLRFDVRDFAVVEAGSGEATGALAGRVRSGPGYVNAVSGIEVVVRQGDFERRTVSTSDGTFRLDGLPQGIYTLDARSASLALDRPDLSLALVFPGRTRQVDLYVRDVERPEPVPPVVPERLTLRDRRLARLARQMDQWIETGIDTYDLDVDSLCMMACGRFTFRVTEGESRILGDPPYAADQTTQNVGSLESLFEFVLKWIVRTPDAFDVEYNRVLGYPTRFVVEGSPDRSDDEQRFEVLRLTFGRRPP